MTANHTIGLPAHQQTKCPISPEHLPKPAIFDERGLHVILDLEGISTDVLCNRELLIEVVRRAAEKGNMHIVEPVASIKYDVGGNGVSVNATITESHIAGHTWPEDGYISLDVFSCGMTSDPVKAAMYIISQLNPTEAIISVTNRGRPSDSEYTGKRHDFNLQEFKDFASLRRA